MFSARNLGEFFGFSNHDTERGWAPRTSKWLGSPLFISHEKGVYKGNNPILRGFTSHGY